MRAIARRLGFDLVSLRLELFGRRRGSPESAHAEALPSAAGNSVLRPAETEHAESGRDPDAQQDSGTAGREPRLRDTIRGASR